MAAIVEAAALGQIDFYLPKPVWSPDEQFHRTITESLAEWWRQQGGQFAAVTVIGKEPSARVYELRDLLTRNSVPFGFQRADSEEGSAALQRLGLDPSSGPVVAFHTGVVLADPANADWPRRWGWRLDETRSISGRRRVDRHPPGARLSWVSACPARGLSGERDTPIRPACWAPGSMQPVVHVWLVTPWPKRPLR